ncbi:MAG: protease modulator HflC [Planctomycetota bacterium]|jgi:membrane protease subunit HflC
MKSIAITILVLLLVTILGLYLVSFQVRQTEFALVTTFGKPVRELTEPRLYFKWPPPIQRIHKFDSRLRVFEADLGETTTKGAVPIIVKTYVVWRIARPLDFFNAVGTVKEAENKLRSQLGNTQNEVIGQHSFSEFINSDVKKIRFEEIEEEMLTSLQSAVAEDYGIEVRALGIKQLKVSKDVSKDIFERMQAERNAMTQNTISEGTAEAGKIRADAEMKKTILLSTAESRAKTIRGEGDAEAAKYYEMLQAEPELAMFLRDIEALKKILEKRSTIILSTDSEPFKLLRQIPTLDAKE